MTQVQNIKDFTREEMFKTEPILRSIIIKCKRNQNKWEAYSEGKYLADQYVGWHARKEELRTQCAYNLFIDALCEGLGL